MATYDVQRGNQTGGSDDRDDRWYLVGPGPIDKRGPGYATRADALEALLERLSGAPVDDGPALVGVAEIAGRAGKAEATVHSWRRRHGDFPEPIVRLASGPVWDWRTVAPWIARRQPGRPSKA